MRRAGAVLCFAVWCVFIVWIVRARVLEHEAEIDAELGGRTQRAEPGAIFCDRQVYGTGEIVRE